MPIPLQFSYRGNDYDGVGIPVMSSCGEGVCRQLDITLNKKHLGIIRRTKTGWSITGVSSGLTKAIGALILDWTGMNNIIKHG